jgi:hypothetical protein
LYNDLDGAVIPETDDEGLGPSTPTSWSISQRGSVNDGNQDDEYTEGNLDDIDIEALETGGFTTMEDTAFFSDDAEYIQEDSEDESEGDGMPSTASNPTNLNNHTICEVIPLYSPAMFLLTQ